MAELIAQGNASNFYTIPEYEDRFKEGERGKLIIGLKYPIPDSVVSAIETGLREAGVTLTGKVTQTTSSSATLTIPFQKGFPWLAVIIGVIAIWLIVSAWRLEKETGIPILSGLFTSVWTPFIIVGIIILVVFWYMMRR